MRALEAVGVLHEIPLALVAVSEEEVGSPESQPMLRDMAKSATCGLVFESGRPGDVVVTRRKGTGAVKVTAHGRAAHAGNAHEEGRNAIWALARFVDAAQRLTDYQRGVTVNVGRIEGGQGKNTVPELATALVDFRFVADADADAVADALRKAADASAVQGTHVDLELTVARRALERSERSAALLASYLECARAAGLGGSEAPLQGGGSDANTLSSVGVPCIDALGPRGEGYHTKTEYIELSSLVPKADALVRFLLARRPRA
jgi:glutamate carboxypeptidase